MLRARSGGSGFVDLRCTHIVVPCAIPPSLPSTTSSSWTGSRHCPTPRRSGRGGPGGGGSWPGGIGGGPRGGGAAAAFRMGGVETRHGGQCLLCEAPRGGGISRARVRARDQEAWVRRVVGGHLEHRGARRTKPQHAVGVRDGAACVPSGERHLREGEVAVRPIWHRVHHRGGVGGGV